MVEFGIPYWWEQGKSFPDFSKKPSEYCDLLVIGAGFTGLSASITSSRLKVKTICVDKGIPGEGASTRNGGMCGAHSRVGFESLCKSFGLDIATKVLKESPKAFEFVKKFIEDESIECNFEITGRIQLANTKSHTFKQKKMAKTLSKIANYKTVILDADEIGEHILSNQYFGGLYYEEHAGLNPRKFHDEMIRVALKSGVEILDNCSVMSYKKIGKHFFVKTTKGIIKTKNIILATNGYTKKPFKWFFKRVFPLPSFIIATEELDKGLIKTLAPGRRMMVETGSKHCYYRISPDGNRILFGGRAGMIPYGPAFAAKRLRKAMVAIWPQLKNVKITHSWMGNTGFTFEQTPCVGEHNGVYFSFGYSGSGVAMAPYLGMKCAFQALGDPRGETIFSSTKPSTRFYHFFQNPIFLFFAEIWYRQFVDRWEAWQANKDNKS